MIVKLNLSFCIINDENFWKLFLTFRSQLIISHQTKFVKIIFNDYNAVRKTIKIKFKKSNRVSVALNEWTNLQKIMFLKVLMYWIDNKFQYQEKLIEFQFLNIDHDDRTYNQHFLQLCEYYDIKKKLLKIVIDNASNNDIMKKKFKKTLNNRTWNKNQNEILYLIHIINFVTQNFIKNMRSKSLLKRDTIQEINDQHITNLQLSTEIVTIVKKINNWNNASK